MKWILSSLLLAICAVILSGGMAYAASPSIDDIKVFQTYEESGDWLIVCLLNISGGNESDCTNTSCCDRTTYPWYIQLIDNTTSTVITEDNLEQCGLRPASIYRSFDAASSLVWAGNYSVKIYGNYGSLPNTSRTINDSDWKGSVSSSLFDAWVIDTAETIEEHDGVTYLETVPIYNDVLNTAGALLFETGISHLGDYKPDLFLVTVETVPVGYTPSSDDLTYSENLYENWDDTIGPTLADALTATGFYFGIDGHMMLTILTLFGFLAIAILEKSIAFMVVCGGIMIGAFYFPTIALLVFLLLIVFIRGWFWSST